MILVINNRSQGEDNLWFTYGKTKKKAIEGFWGSVDLALESLIVRLNLKRQTFYRLRVSSRNFQGSQGVIKNQGDRLFIDSNRPNNHILLCRGGLEETFGKIPEKIYYKLETLD